MAVPQVVPQQNPCAIANLRVVQPRGRYADLIAQEGPFRDLAQRQVT